MNRDLEIGDRVTLSAESEWAGYEYACGNPTDCEGTVCEFDADGWCCVKWDDGAINSYRQKDSDLIKVKG